METAPQFRRTTERIIDATLIVILLLISISALDLALAYRWTRVDVYQSTSCPCTCTEIPCTDPCCKSKGTISMGLFDLQLRNLSVGLSVVTEKYETLDFSSSSINVNALPVVVAGSLISAVLSFVCLFIVGINMWFSTKSVFYGPHVVYLLCFFSSVFSVTALGVYLDFHIWTFRDGVNLVPKTYLYLFDKRLSYIPLASLDWAFYVHAGGAGCSVIAFALASRLAFIVMPDIARPKTNDKVVVLPPLPEGDVFATNPHLEENDSLNDVENLSHFSDSQGETSDTAVLHEKTSVI